MNQMWIASDTREGARKFCPLGFVITGSNVIDKGSGKLVWEAVRVVPDIQKTEEDDERPMRGLGQAENAPTTPEPEPTPTGVVVVGGVMLFAIVAYLAYTYFYPEEEQEPIQQTTASKTALKQSQGRVV